MGFPRIKRFFEGFKIGKPIPQKKPENIPKGDSVTEYYYGPRVDAIMNKNPKNMQEKYEESRKKRKGQPIDI
ncbi:MAG: hypothetical protein JW703_04010 [Candidatus Diapherotrites archaeon]|nr:hypothetical protein [Candidatus Diapherotrites archaeon]